MTLPAYPNPISMSHINTEVEAAAGATRDMAWVSANSKIAAKNLGAVRGFAWYQWTGNQLEDAFEGRQCSRCACSGGDTRAWLQANCNCNCTGNCNCNCRC